MGDYHYEDYNYSTLNGGLGLDYSDDSSWWLENWLDSAEYEEVRNLKCIPFEENLVPN